MDQTPIPHYQPAPTPPPTPAPVVASAPKLPQWVWVALIGVIVLAGAAYAWLKIAPSSPAASPSPSASASVSATPGTTANWKPYMNTSYGFSFWYPASLQKISEPSRPSGAAESVSFSAEGNMGLLSVVVYNTALSGVQTLYEGVVPISKLQTRTIGGKTAYFYRDGDAGCGGTSYYIPLTASSYIELAIGACEGDPVMIDQDMDSILGSFRFSATPGPAPTALPTSGVPLSDWGPFSSKYFTLSFKVPPGFEVEESQNTIRIAKAPFVHREIGDDNAFFVLTRYEQGDTSAKRKAAFLGINPDRWVESSVNIDGIIFPAVSGTDAGRFEGDSAGQIFAVFFDKSYVEILSRPMNQDVDFDPIAIGKQILSTFKFSRTASAALCSGTSAPSDEGGTAYPIAEKYSALGYLGMYLTAEDCSPQRLAEVIKGQYPRPESITLKNSPSAALVSVLQQAGLAPSPEKCANTPATSCKSWRTLHEQDLVPTNLLKLRPFIDVIESVDCYFCG